MNSIKFIPHTADIAIAVQAKSIEELFENAAKGWLISSYKEKHLYKNEIKNLTFTDDSLELLLVEFLSELNFLLHTKNWLFHSANKIIIIKNDEEYTLKTELYGENIEGKNLELKEEIKAITFHNLEIKKTTKGFETNIVFDI